MTMWDFFHAHAEGLGALLGFVLFGVFIIWFIREVNK